MPPKYRTDTIDVSDITEFLQLKDDFQFELDVFHSCIEKGFTAEHGGLYVDSVTGKDRQFDIRLRYRKDNGACFLKAAIECKRLHPSYPLMVSCVRRRPEESFHEVLVSDEIFSVRPGKCSENNKIRPSQLYPPAGLVGKSTTQVGRKDGGELTGSDAEVYEKWTQALGSAHDLIMESHADFKTGGLRKSATVIIPILVIPDCTLWTVNYSEDGQRMGDPEQCNECTVFLGKSFKTNPAPVHYSVSHLHIFTRSAFGGFLGALIANPRYWDTIFSPHAVIPFLTSYP